ncbi:DUF2062 domain-containing protein [Pontiellaceae bacterium B12219]|nr:DUF2062 domain-containing protein [Pontiellaceae bacterium B12219]
MFYIFHILILSLYIGAHTISDFVIHVTDSPYPFVFMRPPSIYALKQSYVRLLNHKGSPESIARGAAIGLWVGMVIPFSFQMLIALPIALLLKAAKFPALLFTWISNPLSIPFIYPIQCYVGSYLIGRPLSYEAIRSSLDLLIEAPSISHFFGFSGDLIYSFFAGGIFFGSVFALTGYFLTIQAIQKYRIKRAEQKERKLKRLNNKKSVIHETC